jgi:hypothetical protein
LKELQKQVEAITQPVVQAVPCEISLNLKVVANEVVLSGNQEGLLFLSNILLSLAAEASDGQHFHFDENTTFDRCDKNFIIAYRKAGDA